MTAPPLPDVPCVRVRLIGRDDVGNDWGVRFYLRYTGSAPSGNDCVTLAGDVQTAFATSLAGLMQVAQSLTEVDVLDIASNSGLSGQTSSPVPGTRAGNIMPIQTAAVVEFGIARRYRGGKPRVYWPFGVVNDMLDQAHWTDAFRGAFEADTQAFFEAIEAETIGSMGTLQHVNLSYYSGFEAIKDSSGRYHNVPTYRPTAKHDDITSYIGKAEMGSQKRRRTATTP